MGCGCHSREDRKKSKYKCEFCGAESDEPKQCCGKAMKKVK